MRSAFYPLLYLLISPIYVISQNVGTKDSVLSFANYWHWVKDNHPYIKNISIITQKADAQLISNKKDFDPYLSYEAGSKKFIEDYYQYSNAEIKIPLWWGMDVEGGLLCNTGPRLDNEISPGQTSYLGIQIPLLKNLIYDKRRAAVQQAKIAQKQSRAEQILESNEFLYDAALGYFRWAISYELLKNAESILNNNKNRMVLLKNSVRFGDRPAIDTVEQLTQLQSFDLLLQNAKIDLNNAGFIMQVYYFDSTLLKKTTK